MKKLEKYKSAAGEICKIQGEAFCANTNNLSWKAVPPAWLPKIISPPPLNVSPPWLLKFSSCPSLPGWWHKSHIPSWSQGGRTLWLRSKFLWFRINMHGNSPAFWNPGQLPLYNSPLDNYIENCFKLSCLESEFHLSKASIATDTL